MRLASNVCWREPRAVLEHAQISEGRLLSSATRSPKIIQDGSSFSDYKQEESLKLHYLGKCALQDTSSQIPIFSFSRELFHKRLQTFIHTESIEGQPKPFLFQHNSGIQQQTKVVSKLLYFKPQVFFENSIFFYPLFYSLMIKFTNCSLRREP